jgi:PAS domain S-box-containing protein
MGETSGERAFAESLVAAFVRIAQGDFSVRMVRSHQRDIEDTLAFFVNMMAEELERLIFERDRIHRELQESVMALSESFLELAAGNFDVRAQPTGRGDIMDILSQLFNQTAVEVGEAFLQRDRQRMVVEAILDSMIDGVLLLDAAGVIQRPNGAFARLLGWQPDQLLGKHIGTIMDARESEFASRIAEEVREHPFRDRDTLFGTAEGEIISVAVNGSAYRDATGDLVGIVLVARDNRELKGALAQLQMTDRLAAVGTVAAGVAHEINNPLSYVMSNLEYVVEEIGELDAATLPRVEEIIRALKSAQQGADRVRQIVRDLKTFSRVDTDTIKPIDLNRLAESSISMIRNEIRHHAQLVRQLGSVPVVEANEARLGQVILNLVQNAAQAIAPGNVDENVIRVSTFTDSSGNAVLEVQDSGSGIAPEIRARIFDAFFTTKPLGVGTGLGLAICHKVVTAMKGTIEVETEVGRGSLFRVILPSAPPKQTEESEAPTIKLPTRSCRLLVVDDEAEVGESIRRILGRDHHVVVVTRGAQALELLERNDYDLILSDLLMPDMTGMELHQRISETRPDLLPKMAFMTGGAFSPGARSFLDKSPNPKLEKPLDSNELRRLASAAVPKDTSDG